MQPELLHLTSDELRQAINQIEALLFATETSINQSKIIEMFGWSSARFLTIRTHLENRLQDTSLELMETASGFRLQIRKEYSPIISSVWPDKQTKLSQAMLETISIVAYKQPVTRADIEQIRGVSTSSSILRQLFDKGWIVEKGFRDLPGKPTLLHTTKIFLDAFNLKDLKNLPKLPQLKDISEMNI